MTMKLLTYFLSPKGLLMVTLCVSMMQNCCDCRPPIYPAPQPKPDQKVKTVTEADDDDVDMWVLAADLTLHDTYNTSIDLFRVTAQFNFTHGNMLNVTQTVDCDDHRIEWRNRSLAFHSWACFPVKDDAYRNDGPVVVTHMALIVEGDHGRNISSMISRSPADVRIMCRTVQTGKPRGHYSRLAHSPSKVLAFLMLSMCLITILSALTIALFACCFHHLTSNLSRVWQSSFRGF